MLPPQSNRRIQPPKSGVRAKIGFFVASTIGLRKSPLRVQFDVCPTDKIVDSHIDQYAKGIYGTGTDGLNNLFEALSDLGYDVRSVSDNTYHINRAIDVCVKRTIKHSR